MVSKLTPAQTSLSSAPKIKQKSSQKTSIATLDRNFAQCPVSTHRAYAKINFSGALAFHKSWGAAVQKNGDVNFKLFTWPDVKKVFVQVSDCIHPKAMAHEHADILPQKNAAGEIISFETPQKGSKFFELHNQGEGVFERKAASGFAKNGQDYRFVIVKADNSITTVKDPYSMRQPSILGWSKVYDHNQFKWTDDAWMSNKVKDRISRKHHENGLTNPYETSIYEMHTATLTKSGTFEEAQKQLRRIKRNGFDTIHIMPVENTHSFNWGYDGVDKFAPQESVLGGPDELKKFIDAAHAHKLNVFMDIVPNHIGTDGNFLNQAGPYTNGSGPFGDKFNYEGKDSKNVREYISNAAMLWLRDYHCDGLRVDMTKFMESDFALKEMNAEVHAHHPDAFIILEDGRENDARVTRALRPEEETFAKEEDHIKYIDDLHAKIFNKDTSILGNLGGDSEWNFPYHKQIASSVLGAWDGKNRDLVALDGAIRGSGHRVQYAMSHDEEGNWDGTKLIVKSLSRHLDLFSKMDGASDCERGQRAAHFAQKLCVAIASGRADKMDERSWGLFQTKNNMKEILPLEKVKQAFITGIRSNKLATGLTSATKGITMIFQGNEKGALNYFKFGREFSSPENVAEESAKKGYTIGRAAFEDSKLDSINYSQDYKKTMLRHELFVRTLNQMKKTVPALKSGEIVSSIIHEGSAVYGLHRQKGDSEIFAVSNFSDFGYDNNYGIRFPEGKWRQVVNSDSKRFGGEGKFENKEVISSSNDPQISLPPNSIVFFEKIKTKS